MIINKQIHLSINDQILFSQKLALLLDSNISLVNSLIIIRDMESNANKIKIYSSLIENCERGLSLSRSMEVINLKLDYILVTLIRNGELSGTLPSSLNYCSKNLEKRNEINKKIISSLVYPVFILVATTFMATFLVMYVFPKILPMLDSLNIQLPLMTRIIKFIYLFLTNYWIYIIFIISISLISISILYRRNLRTKIFCHSLLFKIPIISNYVVLINNSILCSTGEIFLNSGQSLFDYQSFSRETINNLLYRRAFDQILTESRQGIAFSSSIDKHKKLFSKIMINMCRLGEQTGNLGNMMGYSARIFEQDIDNTLKRFTSLIEPVLMIFMGVVIGSISLSIILPVYAITNHLSH